MTDIGLVLAHALRIVGFVVMIFVGGVLVGGGDVFASDASIVIAGAGLLMAVIGDRLVKQARRNASST